MRQHPALDRDPRALRTRVGQLHRFACVRDQQLRARCVDDRFARRVDREQGVGLGAGRAQRLHDAWVELDVVDVTAGLLQAQADRLRVCIGVRDRYAQQRRRMRVRYVHMPGGPGGQPVERGRIDGRCTICRAVGRSVATLGAVREACAPEPRVHGARRGRPHRDIAKVREACKEPVRLDGRQSRQCSVERSLKRFSVALHDAFKPRVTGNRQRVGWGAGKRCQHLQPGAGLAAHGQLACVVGQVDAHATGEIQHVIALVRRRHLLAQRGRGRATVVNDTPVGLDMQPARIGRQQAWHLRAPEVEAQVALATHVEGARPVVAERHHVVDGFREVTCQPRLARSQRHPPRVLAAMRALGAHMHDRATVLRAGIQAQPARSFGAGVEDHLTISDRLQGTPHEQRAAIAGPGRRHRTVEQFDVRQCAAIGWQDRAGAGLQREHMAVAPQVVIDAAVQCGFNVVAAWQRLRLHAAAEAQQHRGEGRQPRNVAGHRHAANASSREGSRISAARRAAPISRCMKRACGCCRTSCPTALRVPPG